MIHLLQNEFPNFILILSTSWMKKIELLFKLTYFIFDFTVLNLVAVEGFA